MPFPRLESENLIGIRWHNESIRTGSRETLMDAKANSYTRPSLLSCIDTCTEMGSVAEASFSEHAF